MMTTHERRQLQDERNRLRRMHEVALDRGVSENNEAVRLLGDCDQPQEEAARKARRRADRYFALSDRTHHRLGEIIECLGRHW